MMKIIRTLHSIARKIQQQKSKEGRKTVINPFKFNLKIC
jgi:hypothetical protein